MGNSDYLSSKLCSYAEKGKSAALPSISQGQLGIFNARCVNNSGSVANVGIGRLQSPESLQYLSVSGVTSSTGTYAVVPFPTASVPQDAFDGTANQGFVVSSGRPLNLIGVTVSTLNSGGTFKIDQWNGTAWIEAGDILEQVADYNTTGDKYHVFSLNNDVVKGGDASLAGVASEPENKYFTRIYTTGVLGGAVVIDDLWAMAFIELRRGIIDKGQLFAQYDWRQFFLLEAGESLAPYFSEPSSANQFASFFTTAGL